MSQPTTVRKAIADHTGVREGKPFKSTLFESERLLLGVNCLEPGQRQAVHTHAGQDKFYLVVSGRGDFTVGEERFTAGPNDVIWAAAEVPHGVENTSDEQLVVVMGISPWR